ncbi:30S ribosome-binding factor RbfA [Alphaproteobacteria bacterium]|nr:30S ribosome-binding factor RbfA [Alphaproteobacteria bacterium]MDB2668288.1 30S ribosome-binding factor RbfA [Alphaproteobacteria bacterium]MDC0131779.1 30S ribosome-binding factor RbfA [Alphaproteobacteria bacterium]MDC0148305.1 30S ribosome-binding factor RbfA [Alphaproteobacteria bacterium]
MAAGSGKKNVAGKPPTQRQLRVGELLRHRLSEVLHRGDFEAKVLKRAVISVTEVRISPDLRYATAYIMPLGGDNLEKIVELLNLEVPRLKKNALTGMRMKFTPDIKFAADDSFDQAVRMDALLASQAVARDTEDEDGE